MSLFRSDKKITVVQNYDILAQLGSERVSKDIVITKEKFVINREEELER
jgi:hypothetical protein